MSDNTNIIRSLDRALQLIDLLFNSNNLLGISEIAKSMGEYKSTIHRTLTTLEERGFVLQDSESQKYGLGPKLYAIGISADTHFVMRETIRPFADKLAAEFQETVNVAIADSSYGKFSFLSIYQSEGKDKFLRLHTSAHANSACHCSSLGKSLLAFTPDFESLVNEMSLDFHTEKTITNSKDLIKNLQQVKKDGYALDDEELEIGLTCVGVPIFNSTNMPVVAMSISGPTSRMQGQMKEMIQRLKETSAQISAKLR